MKLQCVKLAALISVQARWWMFLKSSWCLQKSNMWIISCTRIPWTIPVLRAIFWQITTYKCKIAGIILWKKIKVMCYLVQFRVIATWYFNITHFTGNVSSEINFTNKKKGNSWLFILFSNLGGTYHPDAFNALYISFTRGPRTKHALLKNICAFSYADLLFWKQL